MKQYRYILFLVCYLLLGCSRESKVVLRLGTTTSVNDTGLLDMLSSLYLKEKKVELQWISAGTGKALALGKNCDVDFVLTHAPSAEKEAISSGSLQERIPIMKNYFIIVGPESFKDAVNGDSKKILHTIADRQITFISRGDDSGTHKKELALWSNTGISNEQLQAPWYMETGQGMLQSLLVAEEKQGFILTDIATWYKFKEAYPQMRLIPYTQEDTALENMYSTLFVNKERCPNINDEKAREFVAWLISRPIQHAIAEYKLYGMSVFSPLYQDGLPVQ